jgi:hypothetical protein
MSQCGLGYFHGKPLHSCGFIIRPGVVTEFSAARMICLLADTISVLTQTEIVCFSAVSFDAKEVTHLSTRAGLANASKTTFSNISAVRCHASDRFLRSGHLA